MLLILLAFCLSGCSASQNGSIPQAADTVSAETISADTNYADTNTADTDSQVEAEQTSKEIQTMLPDTSESQLQTEKDTSTMIKVTVGSHTFLAELEDTTCAKELEELLQNGPITMSASNYGGFEKVCSLGTRLTSEDVQITTQPGDIMLYSSDQIVIFYGTNSWAYTRLAKVADEDIENLEMILSGNETEVIIELTAEGQ